MQRATLGKSGSKTASQLQGQAARVLTRSSLGNTMEITAAIQYILTATQSLGSQDYYKKWCIILPKRLAIDKMDYCMFRRKFLLGCLGYLREAVKQQ